MSWRHHDMTLKISHRDFHHLSHFRWNKWYRLDPGVDFTIFEAEEPKNDKRIYVELTRDLKSDYDVTISWPVVFILLQMTQYWYWCRFYHIRGWGTRTWWNYYVELARDLESDCDVTISVTCRISSNTDATDSILVSISPYSRPRNSKMIKLFM